VTAITNALTGVIEWIYGIIQNHGWSIVIFTLLIRFVLMPLDISSRKGMRKMAKIQPQITALQKKYANDKAKLQQKQSELMRKEHYNPMSGCLPLLIQMPILFAMFGAMRAVANEKIVEQVFTFLQGQKPTYEGWLWVKNLWMADSLFAPVAPNLSSIQAIGQDVWHRVWITLGEGQQQLIIQNIAQFGQSLTGALDFSSADALKAIFSSADSLKTIMPSITSAMVQMPIYIEQTALMSGFQNGINLFLFKLDFYRYFNGLLILPVLAGASQVLMTKINPQAAGQQPAAPGQQAGMGNFMKYFFPLFSVYICLTSNAAFALYWVTSNLIATAMSYGINMYYDRKEKLVSQQQLQEGTLK
jgi:YidC/Oxa1 family membrane protein insertase